MLCRPVGMPKIPPGGMCWSTWSVVLWTSYEVIAAGQRVEGQLSGCYVSMLHMLSPAALRPFWPLVQDTKLLRLVLCLMARCYVKVTGQKHSSYLIL